MANDAGDGTDALAVLSQFFVDDGTLGDTLQRVVELARDTGPADTAAVTLQVEGKPRTGACTDDLALQVDEVQYTTGEGPCLDAFHHQATYRIDDTGTDTRWPAFAQGAAAHGVRSTLSVPIGARGQPLGALNLYATRRRAFDEASADRMAVFARQAAIVLSNSQIYWDARQLCENLEQAMESRATIDHAIGILMASGAPGPGEAFQILVRASQRENRKLRDVAADIVARATRRGTRGGPLPAT